MRRRFRFSPSGGAPHDPWFHLGTLEVGTTVGVTILSGFALFFSAIVGFGSPLVMGMVLDPAAVLHGQVWRLVTWPFAYPGFTLWTVLTIVIFWYFGRDLENELLGRKKMLELLVGVVLACSAISVLMYAAFGGVVLDATLNTVQLMVLLAWIAEWPHRPFFFNIPAWVVGLVIVAISVLSEVGNRSWYYALYLLAGIAVSAIIARSLGMLSEHHIVPHFSRPRRKPKQQRTHRHPSQGPRVVTGPWEGSSAPRHENKDEARMNELLEKIHAQGSDALTDRERKELLELRDRLRNR